EHIQVKDHEVDVTEFRSVLAKFVELDQAHPGLYGRYILASPSLSSELRRLRRALNRWRNATPFFDTEPGHLEPTEEAIHAYITDNLKLAAYADFVLARLNFDTDLHNLHHDGKACEAFIGLLLRQEAYQTKFRGAAEPAYTMLLREVEGRRGK